MSIEEVWGVVFLTYMVPAAAWLAYCLAHGVKSETDIWIWIAGLAALLALHTVEAPPGFGIIVCVAVAGGVALRHFIRWRRARATGSPPYVGP